MNARTALFAAATFVLAASPARAQARLVLTPPAVDFGFVATLSPQMTMVNACNMGTGALEIDAVELKDPSDPVCNVQLPGNVTLPLSLVPSACVILKVDFRPPDVGPHSCEIDLTTAGEPGNEHVVIPVMGEAADPAFSVSTDAVVFSPPSSPQKVTVSNTGKVALAIDVLKIDGPLAASFSVTPAVPPLAIAVGATKDLVLGCAVPASGSVSAKLLLRIQGFTTRTITLACTAPVAPPAEAKSGCHVGPRGGGGPASGLGLLALLVVAGALRREPRSTSPRYQSKRR